MSAHNFWNNFTHGFMHGMFNNNPFLGCMNWGWSFNSWCNPFNTCIFSFPTNLYAYPNVFAQTSIFPLMQDFQMPQIENFVFDVNRLFPTDNWNKPLDANFLMGDVFTKSEGNNKTNERVGITQTDYDFTFSTSKKDKKSSVIASAASAQVTSVPARMTSTSINDKYFDTMLEFILSQEGGYVNDPVDRGGKTNKGVTQNTYDGYRRKNNLPTQDVRMISDNEIREIYYEFYKGSGADKIDNPQMALMVFDVAVGSGISRAKSMFKESGGDIKKFEQLRREFYDKIVQRDPSQRKFIKGWNNRVTNAMTFASANLPESVIA